MRDGRSRAPVVPVVCVGALLGITLAGPERASAAEREASGAWSSRIHVRESHAELAVRAAIRGANRRLARPRCQSVLDEFMDGTGRRLRRSLEATGFEPESYLGTLFYYDGSRHPTCQRSGVLAFTVRGSHVVYVCSDRFYAQYRKSPRTTEVVLIHEMLHSLGLGESPPATEHITARVREACR